jgi:molecular chaperone DnaK (HSP70)
MALLQIAEPGMSLAPHQRRVAIGIDLGTTNSLVALVRNAANIAGCTGAGIIAISSALFA